MSVEVIAEIGNAHAGDFARAIRLLDAAKACGADWGKLQTYQPAELIALRGDGPAPEPWASQGYTMRTLYERAATPFEWLPQLFAHAAEIGLPLFSSVFGAESLAALEAVNCPRYKLAALDYGAVELRQMVRSTGKRCLISSSEPEAEPLGTMLWCPPGYPQTDFRLRNIRNDYDGFSYHGTESMVPVFAVIAGAETVEVHFELDDEPNPLEHDVSLGEAAFTEMVRLIRQAEEILG